MFDPISLATGAALLVTGFGVGRFRRPRRPEEKSTALCACGHTLGEHIEGARCAAQVRRPYYNPSGGRNGKEWVPCACGQYVGPVPVESLFATPTLPPVDGG